MEELMSIIRMYHDPKLCNHFPFQLFIESIGQFSKLPHIIYSYWVYIDLDSWKNVLPRMYIDLYIVNKIK
jgi:hypothetical protein